MVGFKALGVVAGIVAGLLIAVGGAKAQAMLPLTSAAAAAGEAKAPIGWVQFCQNQPAECSFSLREPEGIAMTAQVWRLVQAVNTKVNHDVKPLTDLDHWGVVESWNLPVDGYGDCEDYALVKRKLLAEAGLPRRAMRMTVVIDEGGEGHAVLMLRSDRGDVVLDNKRDPVLSWEDTGYQFIKREAQDHIGWTSLGGATSPVVTASR